MAGGEVRAGEKRASLAVRRPRSRGELFDRDPHLQLRRPRLPLGGGRARARRDLDYVAIEDVGRAVNPHIVHGQAIGALVQGLGGVFLDQVLYDGDAQILNTSLADFVPLAAISPMCAHHHGAAALKTNPLGAKGAGEGGGGGGGDGRQCGGGGARSSRRRGARAAAVARASVRLVNGVRGAGEFSG